MKINIKTLSPVFIGGSEADNLSPYSDYIQHDDKIILLDPKKLSELISKDNSIIEKYVSKTREMDESGTHSKFVLENFINNEFGVSTEELKKDEYNVYGEIGKNIVHLHINSSGRSFIPGSSIKGAIRTAVFYYWLKNDNIGKSYLMKLIDKVSELYQEKTALEEKKENERLDEFEINRLNNLSKESFINKELSKELNESLLFGNNKSFEFRNLLISDSDFIDKNNSIVLNSIRYNIINPKEGIPVWNLCIDKDTNTNILMTIRDNFNNQALKSYFNSTISKLYECINSFSKDILEFEINIFNELNNEEVKNSLSGVIEYYEYLKKIINNSNNQYCIMRLGAGKTYYDNSIGLLIYNYNKEIFERFISFLKIKKESVNTDNYFPVTRSFYEKDAAFYPPGWIAMGNVSDLNDISFSIRKTIIKKDKPALESTSYNSNQNIQRNKNYILAEICDILSKPPIIKILEGEYKDQTTILPGIRLDNLGLTINSKIYVELSINKKKKIEKADYKSKFNEDTKE